MRLLTPILVCVRQESSLEWQQLDARAYERQAWDQTPLLPSCVTLSHLIYYIAQFYHLQNEAGIGFFQR